MKNVMSTQSTKMFFTKVDFGEDWQTDPNVHWHWTGPVNNGTMIFSARLEDEKRANNKSVRRLLWMMFYERYLPSNYKVLAACGERSCIRPSHYYLSIGSNQYVSLTDEVDWDEATEFVNTWLKVVEADELIRLAKEEEAKEITKVSEEGTEETDEESIDWSAADKVSYDYDELADAPLGGTYYE